jgi:hypothetical protein
MGTIEAVKSAGWIKSLLANWEGMSLGVHADLMVRSIPTHTFALRHARPCAGHPRFLRASFEDVDGRDKPGHDDIGLALLAAINGTLAFFV